jgi:predicted ATPase/DNA-binding winged helix-turn-helix (wHTH) protein
VGDPGGDIGEQCLAFGGFKLFRAQKVLLDGDRPVRIGGRALDILIALIERHSEVVSKRELVAIAWPSTFVDESNLRVHIAMLRKLLGDGRDGTRYILNVAGRGYSFVAPVISMAAPGSATQTRGDSHLPISATKPIGRDEVVAALIDEFTTRRFITIVGPGGMGKSTVAILIASQLAQLRNYPARFIDLAAVEEGAAVAAAVATTLGVTAATADPVASLIAYLADQRMMLVFDNCEHVIEAVAPLVERIVRHAVGVDLLMTSREALLVETEWVHRLKPLESPPQDVELTAKIALAYPAVQLFLERAMSNQESFMLDDAQATVVANVCRRLDGVPLAIELVAARTDLFGVSGLEKALDDRLLLLTRGRRTSLPRQQSLRGALDWSYALLTPIEQAILRGLSTFRGPFELSAAIAVVSSSSVPVDEVLEGVVSLAAKSLLASDTSTASIRYRLLHVTRVYALQKLAESGDEPALRKRHAEHLRTRFVAARDLWDSLNRAEWLAEYGYSIDDIRAALDWAFSENGDPEIGATLTAATLPIGYQMSLIDEFKMRAKVALAALATLSPPQPVAEIRIRCVLGWISMNTDMDPVKIDTAFKNALSLAHTVEGVAHRIEPLLGFVVHSLELGDYEAATRFSAEMHRCAVEAEDPLAILLADRAAAQACHWLGDHSRARQLAQRVIRHPAISIPLSYSQTSVDRKMSMRIVLARTMWIEGRAEQASHVMQDCMEIAYSDSPFAIGQGLALGACPIALWRGDDAEAERLIAKLLDYSNRFNLDRWRQFGVSYHNVMMQRRAQTIAEREGTWLAGWEPKSMMQRELLVTIDERMVDGATVKRATDGVPSWCAPELLRASGELWLRNTLSDHTDAAEAIFVKAIKSARAQKALSWELRAATSLAAVWRDQRASEAQALLEEVLSRFTEGHETADLKRATCLLIELGAPVPNAGRVSTITRH